MSTNAIPMTTPEAARTARNRASAAHSSGPKTEAGKRRSSLNAMRHGLTGHTVVMPAEDLDAHENKPLPKVGFVFSNSDARHTDRDTSTPQHDPMLRLLF